MKKIAPDKWKHFIVGVCMGMVLPLFYLWLIPLHPFLAWLLAFTTIVVISYGFELFSLITGIGYYEVMDAVAAVIGGLVGMGGYYIFIILI